MEVTATLGPVSVLSVSGSIDAATFPQLVREANQVLDAGHVKLVIDLSGVGYVSSGGLVALQTIAGKAASLDGKMVLCCVGQPVSRVLGLTGFDQALSIFADITAAEASFAAE